MVGALIYFTYSGSYSRISGIVLVTIYCAYVVVLYMQTKKHRSRIMIEEVKGGLAAELNRKME
ncbi:hypothetical protein OXH55_18895 [Clostridium ganghwense]|uniref:Uncharacterized protein n=1 Tax=Clostridium ganghwense TaxID=312089 RepID=A0ABT4CUC8_9CLOT|nr:hypothetical protein [Clostridium ganghwense]